jgi:hypothetical protein
MLGTGADLLVRAVVRLFPGRELGFTSFTAVRGEEPDDVSSDAP